MSLIVNLTNAIDFGVNKYIKLVNKITHGYNIKVNSKNSSEIQYAVFFKGFNSIETTNLMIYLIQHYPLIKVLNIDFDYNKYGSSKSVDAHFKAKIDLILAQINSKYWHFTLPDFDTDLFELGNTEIIDNYLNQATVELINFIKESQDSLADCIKFANLPLLLFLNNYGNDFTFNQSSFFTNDDPFFKINPQTFLKTNYKNVKMTINFYKYFLYLNKKILKKDIYNVQFCSTKHTNVVTVDDTNVLNKIYNQFRNYEGEGKIKEKINTREWLFKQHCSLISQFWKSLEMEYPYKSEGHFSIKDPYKVHESKPINLKFFTIKTASNLYEMMDSTSVTVPFGPGRFTVMNIPIEPEKDEVPMHRMEIYQTKAAMKLLTSGMYGEMFIYNPYSKVGMVLREHWGNGIHNDL